ncbi:hypothetical protein SELMODRAFT_47162, partial [Selaginella moellendorffii]
LGDLPAGCLAGILGWLSPRDVGRLALVNKTFLEASRSDAVWRRMLPPHWKEVVRDGAGSAMDVYERLSVGVFVEEEKDKPKIYWIDRPTGGVCNMISARALRIVWGDDGRYWDWRSMNGSRFDEVAFLRDVCWLEIRGSFSGYLKLGSYRVSFRLQLLGSHARRRGRGADWHDDAYGWEAQPVIFSLSAPPSSTRERRRYLASARQLHRGGQSGIEAADLAAARVVEDGWMEYDAGEFCVEDEDFPVALEFSLVEIRGGNWKSGLYVDGVVIKP